MFVLESCKKDPLSVFADYEPEIGRIMTTQCAVSGCHNDLSSQNAFGLNLSTWAKMVEGGNSGSVVIAHKPEFSSLFQFVNTHADLGLMATPTMPFTSDPLSREEVILIKTWIEAGCPNRDGEIPFAQGYEDRKKIYFANQGCDVVTVVDAESRLPMRFIDVGNSASIIETPHYIKMSPDKKYWYTIFVAGDKFQKYDAATDQLLDEVSIGFSSWNVIELSDDGVYAFVSDLSSNGSIKKINTTNMLVEATYSGGNLFVNPHGLALSKTTDTIYATAQFGNILYRFIPSAPTPKTEILLEPGAMPATAGSLVQPHEILYSPDKSKLFISCEGSNDIRVISAGVDTLLDIIPVGVKPKEMVMSASRNLLFVSCMEDPNPTFTALKGSIYAIDMSTLQVVKVISDRFSQPRGLAFDEATGELWIANRNISLDGPAPHHTSSCGGRNGFFMVLNVDNWSIVQGNRELSVDPYSCTIR